MSVVWLARRGRRWTEAGLAVPCPVCNARQGEECRVPKGERTGIHTARQMIADDLGFAVAAPAPLLERGS